VWLIPFADEIQGVQVKLCYPLTMRAIPECIRDVSGIATLQIDIIITLPACRKITQTICKGFFYAYLWGDSLSNL